MPLQRRQPDIDGRGQDAAVDAAPHAATLLVLEELPTGCLRPAAESTDRLHRATVSQVYDNRRDSTQIGQVRSLLAIGASSARVRR